MAVRSGFFNSVNGDRKYDAKRFAEYFATIIGNGIFPNPSTNLQVMSNNDMTVTVKAGKAWINGYILINDDDYILQIDPADGVLNRIDKIVARYDTIDREIRLEVKKGNFASNPVVPNIQRDADAYELALAYIAVNKGIVSITQANITDLRLNSELCGIVHGTVNQVDVTTLFNQYAAKFEQKEIDFETEFNAWFDDIKTQLGEDVAGSLLNQINDLAGEGRTTETIKSAHDLAQQAFQSASDGKVLVAGAITGKGVPTDPIDTFSKMASNINAIETDPSGDATAEAPDMLYGVIAYSKYRRLVGTMTNHGAKTFTPSDIKQTSGAGYYSGITVNARPALTGDADTANVLTGKYFYKNSYTRQTGTMPNRGRQTGRITTKGGRITINQGYHDGTGYIDYDDPNHIAANIRDGVLIGGVMGSLKTPLSFAAEFTKVSAPYFYTSINKIYYANGLWVAVGNDGKLNTSTNGTTWTTRTSGFGTDHIMSIYYANGLWVAVGRGGKISTSTNGTTWVLRRESASEVFWDVAYGNGMWVAVGMTGVLYSSPDGITWTKRTSGFGTSMINCVTYDNNLWLIGGVEGKIAASTNGTTWTLRATGITNQVTKILFAENRWIALPNAQSVVGLSTDGTTWTTQSTSYIYAKGAIYIDGLYLAVGGVAGFKASLDGISWVDKLHPLGTGSTVINDIAYDGNGTFIAVNSLGDMAILKE
ncbi:MAG: hypothetical protein RIN55_05545 [Tissierellaceae bacterium]|nr:hypothetical protein [Tissierellaceae bacterium]